MTPIEMMQSKIPELDKWRVRSGSETRPVAGSELASDDADFPHSPLSQFAKAGLSSSWDHLDAFRALVQAGRLMPSAQPTLARASIVGASLAVWLLAPDEQRERLKRARSIRLHNYRRHLHFLNQLGAPEQARLEVKERMDQVKAARQSAGETDKFFDTEAITEAAQVTFLPRYPEACAQTLDVWRQTSGTAHGLVWGNLAHAGTRRTSEPDQFGVAAFVSGPDEETLANVYMCGHWLTTKGWALLDQRSVPPIGRG